MNKKTMWLLIGLIFFLLVIIVGLVIFIVVNQSQNINLNKIQNGNQDNNQAEQNNNVETNNDYEIVTRVLQDENDSYSIDIKYPQVQNFDDEAVQTTMNNAIKDFAEDQANFIMTGEASDIGKNSVVFDFTVENQGNKILSLLMLGDVYTGGAHGNPVVKTFNFNLENGENIEFTEVLKPALSAIDGFSLIAEAKLLELLGDEMADQVAAGTQADASNFMHYNFLENEMKITFDAYQVAPYAVGTPTITIEYSKIEDILREEILEIIQ